MTIDKECLDLIKWNEKGLIPAIVQEEKTGEVLMLAWMNEEALSLTLSTRVAHYYSRSRSRLWQKGESSGHHQLVHEIRLDCDGDTLLLKVTQEGGIACHTGRKSCFFYQWQEGAGWQITEPVLKDPKTIYHQD